MRTTPVATAAGPRRSLRQGGVVMAMLLLVLALIAPSALAEAPADPPPDQAAEPAQENAGEHADPEAREPDEHAADTAQTGEPDERAADNAQTGEPNEHADDAETGDEPNAKPADQARANADGPADPEAGEPDEHAATNAQAREPDEHAATNTQAREPDEHAANADGAGENENAAGGQGNRGHVQLSADGETFPPNNEPHLPCEFFVMFYDMREGTEQATVEFFAQPPSGGPAELLLTDTVSLNGEAGEGVTFNGSKQYDLTEEVAELERHAQQGYHIRLTVTTTPEDVSADQKHHVFWIDCAPADEDEQPAPADLTVTKDVTGDDAPASDTTFTIEIDCDDNATQTAMLADGDSWTWSEDAVEAEDLTEDSTCTIDETVTHGADVTLAFNGDDAEEGDTLELDAGDNAATVTNDFPAIGGPAPADLAVTKDVTGEGAPAASTEFEITLVCDEITEVIELTDGQTWSWNDDSTQDDLTADSTCSIEETDAQDATTVTIAFNDEEITPGTDQDLDAGTNTVLVTNDFATEGGQGGEDDEGEEAIEVGVLPDEVERPAPTPDALFAPNPAPVVEQTQAPATAVQDSTAERLPRTGVSSTTLLVLALTLLGSGAMALRRTRPTTVR